MEKDVEDIFAEKGWTVKMNRKLTKSQKVAKVLRERPVRLLNIAELKDHLQAAPEDG